MNRARRRATGRAPASVRWVADNYRCPDCLSDTTSPVADQFGIWHIEVQHDDTCPWFNKRKA